MAVLLQMLINQILKLQERGMILDLEPEKVKEIAGYWLL
jgi:hypothetical protein